MKIELTERDKKLLTFMGVFVIVVLIGYYLILPQIKKASEYKDEIEAQAIIQSVNQSKIMQLDTVEINNEELEKLIDGAKDNYYPMMDSEQVDRLVTNTVIEKYGLMAYDLSIGERVLAGLAPYVYSEKALTGKSDARERALTAAAPIISEDGMIMFADAMYDESSGDAESLDSYDGGYESNETTGIYTVTVQMRLSGDKENIIRLLDDLALSDKKLRLVDYYTDTETIIIPHEDGTQEIYTTESLNISVELYMCED